MAKGSRHKYASSPVQLKIGGIARGPYIIKFRIFARHGGAELMDRADDNKGQQVLVSAWNDCTDFEIKLKALH